MAKLIHSRKACTVNPLKMSQPIGAALAFLGLDGCMPVLHGAQGCTSFGLVLFVRHFRETIPLQTTAMNEVTTIMGGMDNLEQAILNIVKRANPRIICIASTGLTETKGDDVPGFLKLIRDKHPEIAELPIVYVSTPDFENSFQEGWARAVTAVIENLVIGRRDVQLAHLRSPQLINVLPGCHLTPADIEELREIIQAFGLHPVFLPDLSGSLDGHVPQEFLPTTLGGTSVEAVRAMGSARATLAIGEQMRGAAMTLEMATGVPYTLLDRVTGLEASDRLYAVLSEWSGRPIPASFRRQRSQLVDAMLDGHFFFGGKRVAIGAEPDLLWAVGNWITEMGAELVCAVTTPAHSSILEQLPTATVTIGDLEDLEAGAAGCDLLITHSHGRQAAERLGVPLVRMGLPIFDRLGAAHRVSVGYRGTRNLIFEVGNVFMANQHENHPDSWAQGSPTHEATSPLQAH